MVIGGGISGLGLSWLAAQDGLSTLLLERHSCTGQTSNNSLRIMHGGFRYLQTLNLSRVIESARDQQFLLKRWPKLIIKLPCLMPLERFGLRSKIPLEIALRLYSQIVKRVGGDGEVGQVIRAKEAQHLSALLSEQVSAGALLWYDALLTDPAALSLELQAASKQNGAKIHEHTEVKKVERVANGFRVSTNSAEFESKWVVNTAGPWVDSITDGSSASSQGWCRCFNIVLNRQLDAKFALAARSRAGRLYFAAPRNGVTAIGTQNLAQSVGSQLRSDVSESEIDTFLRDFNTAFPLAHVSQADIRKLECGVLPMQSLRNGEPVLYGASQIRNEDGYIKVLSTKYTTFRSQALKVLKLLGK